MIKEIEVQNLKCGGCAGTIKSKIGELEGVSNVNVYVDISLVLVQVDDAKSLKMVESKLASLGYPKMGDDNSLGKKAKSFVSCAVGKMSKES